MRSTPVNRPTVTRQERLYAALSAAFAPVSLEVVDDSARHAGHAGATAEGQTHYTVHMVCAGFAGQSRLLRSRAVHDTLAAEFQGGLHALSLVLRSPAEV